MKTRGTSDRRLQQEARHEQWSVASARLVGNNISLKEPGRKRWTPEVLFAMLTRGVIKPPVVVHMRKKEGYE
jgi:hypothetical protein